jgi:hypothetical protein
MIAAPNNVKAKLCQRLDDLLYRGIDREFRH